MNEIKPTPGMWPEKWIASDAIEGLPVYDFDRRSIYYEYAKPTLLQKAASLISGKPMKLEILARTATRDYDYEWAITIPELHKLLVDENKIIQAKYVEEQRIEKEEDIFFANERYAQYTNDKNQESLDKLISELDESCRMRFKYMTDAHADKEVVSALVVSKYDKGVSLKYAAPELLQDRELVMKALETGFDEISVLPKDLRDDIEIFRKICANSGVNFKQGNVMQRDDREAALSASHSCNNVYSYLSDVLKNDSEFHREMAIRNFDSLNSLPESIKADKEIIAKACLEEPRYFAYASRSLKNDMGFIEFLCQEENVNRDYLEWRNCFLDYDFMGHVSGDSIMKYADESLLSDKEFMTKLVANDGLLLAYASTELQSDIDVVLIALNNHPGALSYVSKDISHNPEIYGPLLKDNPEVLYAIDDLHQLPNAGKLILECVEANSNVIDRLSLKFLPSDDERHAIINAALPSNPSAIDKSYESELEDAEYCRKALLINPECFNYINRELRDDLSLALISVKGHKYAYDICSQRLKDNNELAICSANSGSRDVMKNASERLRSVKEVCLAAVTNDVWDIRYVDKSLYDDLDIATAFFKGCEYRNPKEYFDDNVPKPEYPKVAAILNAYPHKNPEDAIAYHIQKLAIDAERLKIELAVPQALMKTTPEVVERPKMRMKI